MGSKNRYLVIVFLFLPAVLNSQRVLDYQIADSLTYSYYLAGKWDNLIALGDSAIENNIDYKHLRQRMGYAYYSEKRFYEAKYQFEKALAFDRYDQFTLEYLYFSLLYSGKESYAGNLIPSMSKDLKESLKLRTFSPVKSVEFEYNFKYSAASSRSNPQYFRFGLETGLFSRLSLYQSFSDYKQTVTVRRNPGRVALNDRQPEYYANLKLQVSKHLIFSTAYHYIKTSSDTTSNYGNLFYLSVSPDLNRLIFEATFSTLKLEDKRFNQTGIQIGYHFPGRADVYFSGTLSLLSQQNDNRLIYNQKAGFHAFKNIWIEGNANIGKMTGYNDYNGLYVYNSFDQMTFRAGATMFAYIFKNVILWINYSYEKKEYYENNSFHYNQFSYLGGIKWKL
jgi:hypothetical protein